MKIALICLFALVACASAALVELSQQTQASEAVQLLDQLREQIKTHGLESVRSGDKQENVALIAMDSAAEPKKDEKKSDGSAINVNFKWSGVDVRNFLTWLVSQNANAGSLDSLKLSVGKDEADGKKEHKKKHCSEEHRQKYHHLRELKNLETAGEHGGLWWFKTPVKGLMNAANILAACKKHGMRPSCDHTAYSDGQCVNSPYDQGRHTSYPPHAIESWQNSFFPGMYMYCGYANAGWPLQNTGSTHRWSGYGEENAKTSCVLDHHPRFEHLKELQHCAEDHHHGHHHHHE